MRSVLLLVPADPLVSVMKVQGCGAEGEATEPAVIGVDEVAQLTAHQGACALGCS
jgi:hypothetical protein